ncbi:hypothetical protein [Tsuneonella suprasediminis]|uniref:hypothetical protein n=1 Tax=Tsuneonella suprasediminis TaxID=2306996 RepID=UPI002F94DBF3
MPKGLERWELLNASLGKLSASDPLALHDALALVYAEIAATPEPLLQDYARFTEDDLTEGLVQRSGNVEKGDMAVRVSSDQGAILLDAGRLLRAIEQNAVECSHFIESDRGEDLEDAWRTTNGRHYVIPRMTALAGIDGKPFLRRALLHYRILPTTIDGFAVRLHRSTLAADTNWATKERVAYERSFGAALFPGLCTELAYPEADTFTVTGLTGCDAITCIDTHLAEAKSGECCAVVWGELTMPEANLRHLRGTLADRALDGCGPLRYLVAGSWHSEIDGAMRNACHVLDGYGEPIFSIYKWAKFVVDGKWEAIVPGDEIHILIGEDELAIVAICRDFLQATTDPPYGKLDVDLAFVPSMILDVTKQETMDAHKPTANQMRVRYGTRTLVVAQPARAGEGGVGQVLAFPSRPLEAEVEIVSKAWLRCGLANP